MAGCDHSGGKHCISLCHSENPDEGDAQMIPGEIFPAEGELVLNANCQAETLMVANTGDRPVQVGSHFHFFEVNDGPKRVNFYSDTPVENPFAD